MELKIDPEFKELIPPLNEDELSLLHDSLDKHGCLDAIKTWEGTVIDGHNRFAYCEENDIEYEYDPMEFDDRNAVMVWIIDNQLGRRNLSKYVRGVLEIEREKYLPGEQAGGDRQTEKHLFNSEKMVPTNRHKSAAASAGVSVGTYHKIKKIHNEGDSEQKARAASGEESIDAIFKEVVQDKSPSKPHVANNSGENEWYTPPEFIEAARKCMGSIDLDPASSSIANQTVQAEKFYTKADNGLKLKWSGNIWMNPPYSSDLIGQFIDKFVEEQGNIKSAIILVNNATETGWFQKLANHTSAICFPSSRIKFLDTEGNPKGAPLQGQAILFYGQPKQDVDFLLAFEGFGFCSRTHFRTMDMVDEQF